MREIRNVRTLPTRVRKNELKQLRPKKKAVSCNASQAEKSSYHTLGVLHGDTFFPSPKANVVDDPCEPRHCVPVYLRLLKYISFLSSGLQPYRQTY